MSHFVVLNFTGPIIFLITHDRKLYLNVNWLREGWAWSGCNVPVDNARRPVGVFGSLLPR
jgi:hypothetical protein